jgi:hypothetical protein
MALEELQHWPEQMNWLISFEVFMAMKIQTVAFCGTAL